MFREIKIKNDAGEWRKITNIGPRGETGPAGEDGHDLYMADLVVATADYAATGNVRAILTNGTGINVELPPAAPQGRVFTIKNIHSTTGYVEAVTGGTGSGLVWTETNNGVYSITSSDGVVSVSYGNEFVVVGTRSGTASYSSTGISWTPVSAPYGGGRLLSGLAFGTVSTGPVYVAVSKNEDGAKSFDGGHTWLPMPMGYTQGADIVTFGGGVFAALRSGQPNGYKSGDAFSWQRIYLPGYRDWSDIIYVSGMFYAVARDNYRGCAAGTAATTWSNWDTTGAGWSSLAFGNGKFVLVKSGQSTGAYIFATGGSWHQFNLPGSYSWNKVRFGDGKFVAIAENSRTGALSFDGINWSTSLLPAARRWTGLSYGAGRFVAAANESYTGAYSDYGYSTVDQLGPGDSGTYILDGVVWRNISSY